MIDIATVGSIGIIFLYWQVIFRQLEERKQWNNHSCSLFYNMIWLTNLAISITFIWWQVFRLVNQHVCLKVYCFAHLITDCAIQYPKIANLTNYIWHWYLNSHSVGLGVPNFVSYLFTYVIYFLWSHKITGPQKDELTSSELLAKLRALVHHRYSSLYWL